MSKALITWSLPTARVNDAPATAADVAKVRVYSSFEDGPPTLLTTLDGPATSYTTDALPVGKYAFSLVAVDTFGTAAEPSTPVTAVISPPAPPPPPPALMPITGVKVDIVD